jgi:hypothetical protein
MKTTPPWWLSIDLLGGLIFILAGQRAFETTFLKTPLTVLGLLAVAVAVGWRVLGYLSSRGEKRRIERITLLCYAAAVAGLLGYFFTTDTGNSLLGISEEGQAKFNTAVSVLWVLAIVCSMVPLVLIEATRGFGIIQAVGDIEDTVDTFRVREMASSGLTIALALGFLMVTCNVASEKNVRKDVSYFKTSMPGTAVTNIVKTGFNETLKVILFFPKNNEVGAEVEAYFKELDSKTGGKLDVERADRMIRPQLAKDYKVSSDGTIVLIKGGAVAEPNEDGKDGADGEDKEAKGEGSNLKSENIRISDDIDRARKSELRELDGKVEKALLQLVRAKKVAYMTTGHGELNDAESAGPLEFNPALKASHIRKLLGALNYRVKNFDGLGKPVPDDCDILLVLAPAKPLLDEELAAIDDYLARGGSVLIGLDPLREARLGVLQGRLGVQLNADGPLTDDKEYMRRRGAVSDRRLILTNQFSSHASVSSLSRGSARSGILLVNAGSLENADFTTGAKKPKRTYVVRSMASSFRDLNNNFQFDKDTEKRNRYNVVAAIEDPDAKPEKLAEGQKPKGMRAVVIADAELFTDPLLLQVPKAMALMADSIKWLGGEEQFQGTVENEKDVKIEQTQSEDAVWFWISIVGVPLIIFGIGMLMMGLRRRRFRRNS